MLNSQQKKILDLLNEHSTLSSGDLQRALKLTRSRIHQLMVPLIKQRIVKREGRARATVYKLSDKRNISQISRENWELRKRVLELEKVLDDRKIIERAKEILIAQFDILPTEAYRKLQEQSMDSGKSMREIAERILSAYEL
jgi:predicted ArsR family transcriptional regulator